MKTVITIARQYGSGGREIGRKLAKKFGVPFYDKELIALAAKKSGISEKVFEEADEKAASSLLYSLLMGNYSFTNGVPMVNNMPVNDKLFMLQAKIIRDAAKASPCVIVGRCADNILSNKKDVLNVFIYADKLSRMDRIVTQYGVDQNEAAECLIKQDKQRANYYNFYTGKKWGDIENCNLAVNSSTFGINGAVELIAQSITFKETNNAETIE